MDHQHTTDEAETCKGCSGDRRFYITEAEHLALVSAEEGTYVSVTTEFRAGSWVAIPCPWCRDVAQRESVLANVGALIEYRKANDLPWIVGPDR